MNNKLELKDIACYLPYALKGIIEDDIYVEDIIDSVGEDFSYTIKSGEVFILGATMGSSFQPESIFIRGDADGYVAFENIKPILRPMTDIVNPLPDGTIPIVELAKIEGYVDTSDKDYKLGSYILDTYGVRFNIENDEDDNEYEVFGWDSINGFGVHFRPSERYRIVGNQRQLWQYLYAHHFDINNLIGRGLAISIQFNNKTHETEIPKAAKVRKKENGSDTE